MDKKTYIEIPPGELIRKELRERRISQKEFANLLEVRPSHLSDIIAGRRRISLNFAQKIERYLGISVRVLMDLQTAFDLANPQKAKDLNEETDAFNELEALDKVVNLSVLLKPYRQTCKTSKEKLNKLKEVYNMDAFRDSFNKLFFGSFRKSSCCGLNERMLATWVVKAESAFSRCTLTNNFSYSCEKELCTKVSTLFHVNKDTLNQLTRVLNHYGIAFMCIEKVEHASIDGYSFMKGKMPCIAVTCRYDRIDNIAFTVMHELGHIFLKHTNESSSRVNIDFRSFDDELYSTLEQQADEFASEYLIPTTLWKCAPSVPVNAFVIQKRYTQWAHEFKLNPWIVLGRMSHETGMYKFKSDDSRKISGGKEVAQNVDI